MSDFNKKIIMVVAGSFWLIYLVLHMLLNLNFFAGSDSFNSFYIWFNEATLLRLFIISLLIISFLLHIFIAVTRQLDSNSKRTTKYKKPYPKGIPRFIAWSGAALLAFFIIFHFTQMQFTNSNDLYSEVTEIFNNPLYVIIYILGFIALGAHLQHSLNNLGQTLGTKKWYSAISNVLVFILIIGFLSVPINVYVF